MNKKQVLTLCAIAIALGATLLIVKQSQKQSASTAITTRAPGETLFKSFPANETAHIEIQGTKGKVTLEKKDGKWTVAQRENYPANTTNVNELIRTLAELKVTRSLEADPSFAPRFGMDENSTTPENRGLTATFKDATGKELAKVSLGKNIEGSQDSSPLGMAMPVGRYIRNHADESGFYAINEMFFSATEEVTRWLAEEFIAPDKIKSVSLSQKGSAVAAWKLTRDSDGGDFKLDGMKPSEALNSENIAPMKNLLSFARFEDVVPAATAAERADVAGKRTAIIETFDGFTYTLTITPVKPGTGSATSSPDNQLVTVTVTAKLPTEREKAEGEKPEDAKTKDEEFANRMKALNEKLAKEQALAGRTFEVSQSTLSSLLKERENFVQKPAPAAPNAGNQSPKAGVEAATPPVEAPAAKGNKGDKGAKKPTKPEKR